MRSVRGPAATRAKRTTIRRAPRRSVTRTGAAADRSIRRRSPPRRAVSTFAERSVAAAGAGVEDAGGVPVVTGVADGDALAGVGVGVGVAEGDGVRLGAGVGCGTTPASLTHT